MFNKWKQYDIFLYSLERRILFDQIEQYACTILQDIKQKEKIDLILREVNLEKEEFISTNITITNQSKITLFQLGDLQKLINRYSNTPKFTLQLFVCIYFYLFMY